jgi:hypothetical protein
LAGVLLLYDNASVHRAKIPATVIRNCGFEELNESPTHPTTFQIWISATTRGAR